VLCLSAQAEQLTKVRRIGFLDRSTASSSVLFLDVLRQELSKLGWVEGKNITIEYRFADQKIERLSAPTRAAKEATATIPIVMAQAPDPVRNGFVTSLAQPGGNVTGLSGLSYELSTKRLEVLKDAVPKLARVGLLWARGDSITTDLALKELRPAALALKLKLEEIETHPDPKGLESAFQTAKHKQVNAIMTTGARPFFVERKRIVELAGKYRLPAIYFEKEFVEAGGLMSYGADEADSYRRAAGYVDKILKGAKPANLPIQQATKFEFVINLKAAKQIDLTIPVRVLERANQVIK